MKIAPVSRALNVRGASTFLVHTGQHYDANMSDVFFKELGIGAPDLHLGVGAGDRITQTRKIKQALVPVLLEQKPDGIIVVGDVTSSAAGAMAGVMANVPVIHVEAGLRSFNWTMPEELNRMIADHHSDVLFIHEESALKNLLDEGIGRERIHVVGNVMIDTLLEQLPKSRESMILTTLQIAPRSYGLVTLHRPDNVDHPDHLREIFGALADVASRIPLVLPLHPRTKQRIETFGIQMPSAIRLIDPVGYLDMLALTSHARLVLTDSGGLQEETTVLRIPCLTLRKETERPVTVTIGSSEIVGRDHVKIVGCTDQILSGNWKTGSIPPQWDGHAAERIADILVAMG